MNFKKTLLALSLCAGATLLASAQAAAATLAPPEAPTPSATQPNLASGVPAYIYQMEIDPKLDNYVGLPFLTNGDRVEANGVGDGNWKYGVSNPHQYVLDFSGASCLDHYGPCAGTPGPGEIEANTVVITYRQHVAAPQEPTASLRVPDPTWTRMYLYNGDMKGVSDYQELKNPGWKMLFTSENNKVKQVITFPTQKFSKLSFAVGLRAEDGIGGKLLPQEWRSAPAIAEVEVFKVTGNPEADGAETREADWNDTLDTAQVVGAETKAVNATMGSVNDSDFYKFVLPPGKSVNWKMEPNVQMSYSKASDYDLYLYDDAGNLVNSSTNGRNMKELLSATNFSTVDERVLRLEVRYKAGLIGADGDYKLHMFWY